MITADQILLHLIGDYVIQSDWMAQNKTKRWLPAFIHAFSYALLFLFLCPSPSAWFVILASHYFIDRYRLARFVVYAKNQIGMPPDEWAKAIWQWRNCRKTGYPELEGPPAWLSVWLLIIADNICHIAINGLAIRYL